MKRLRQWVFNGVAATSLVLMLSAAALWVRGYCKWDVIGVEKSNWEGQLGSSIGELKVGIRWPNWLKVNNYYHAARDPVTFQYDDQGFTNADWQISAWGFGWVGNPIPHRGMTGGFYAVMVPCWFLMVIFALPPIYWLHPIQWRRKFQSGFCEICGYDLRATPNLCPECGTVPKSKK